MERYWRWYAGADEQVTWRNYWLNVGYSVKCMVPSDLRAADPLSAATADDIAKGKRVYDSQCALCHGIGGTGGRGPAFTVPKLRGASNGAELIEIIVSGINGSGIVGAEHQSIQSERRR